MKHLIYIIFFLFTSHAVFGKTIIVGKKDKLSSAATKLASDRLKAETAKKEAKAAKIAAKVSAAPEVSPETDNAAPTTEENNG